MSDENVPKLRLKPKLAGETPAASPAPVEASPASPVIPTVPASAEAPAAPAGGARPNRLKPRITIEPAAENPASAVEAPVTEPAPVPEQRAAPVFPEVAGGASKLRISVKPRAEGAGTAPVAAPEPLPAILDAPPPPGIGAADAGAPNFPPPPGATGAETAEAAALRKASSAPFPPPTAKFPPPAGAKKTAGAPAGKPVAASKANPKLIIGAVAVLVLGGVAFVAFKKFTAAPPPPPPRPVAQQPAVAPAPVATVQQTLEKGKQEQLAPLNEVVGADQGAASSTLAKPADADAQPAPEPVVAAAPPPPPAASLAFKAWVQNLRIGGMRGGANPRVFIEHTAYGPGDIVNPQLGISFIGFNAETRMLVFKDKTGATVELRN